jgi:hypothetical protein
MAQNKKKISFIQRITERILGKKFYISVVAQKGTAQYFVNSTIYRSKQEVLAHKRHVDESCPSLSYICYYSFRSHNDFRLSVGKAVDAEEAKKLAE